MLPDPHIARQPAYALAPIPTGAEAYALMRMLDTHPTPLIFVAQSGAEMERVADQLAFFAPHAETWRFPAWDCLPYDRVSPHADIAAMRMATLSRLARGEKPDVLLTTVNALLQRLPPIRAIKPMVSVIEIGSDVEHDSFVATLIASGYRRASQVIEPGEFAIRGHVIDFFPPGNADAVRLDLFGNTVETIRAFDPLSQRSNAAMERVTIYPAREILLSEETIERFRDRYREQFGAVTKEDPLYEAVSSGAFFPSMEHWLPLFYEETSLLTDYLPATMVIAPQIEEAVEERRADILAYFQAREQNDKKFPYHPLPPAALYPSEAEWETLLGNAVRLHRFASPKAEESQLKSGRRFAVEGAKAIDSYKEYQQQLATEGWKMLLAAPTESGRSRLARWMEEHGLQAGIIEAWDTFQAYEGTIAIAALPLPAGFEDAQEKIAFISEADLLGEKISARKRRRKPTEFFLQEAASMEPGELIVHRDHGIGRFEGLEMLEVMGKARDCLKLVYDGGDRLFLPVENMDMISRYGTEEGEVRLDKLGGVAWQSRKAKMKERITMMAGELLAVAAKREMATAPVCAPPAGLMEEFESRFPYAETEDQLRSIEETLEDLASGKPMDRLICGDVGFGKTEVAMRAAFAAVMSEHLQKPQVAVIVPTTLLCRQHAKNFRARFAGLPVEIAELSRFVSSKEAKEVKQNLEEGKIDIIIGTHALLASSIRFHNLALLILDEEQHFGVKQKEALKKLKEGVHVLTLSATPIPRTLQLALTGVRSLSLIATPPLDRIAVRSFVTPFDPVMLRDALMREKHRGGQSFYVAPRIGDLPELVNVLKELVPELAVAMAHGQMSPSQLDKVMNSFYDGKADILLATNIIESGLDIASANTLIVHRSDRFGLSQLYQLRGRVGRGKLRAYAYFTTPYGRKLTRMAEKRLEVMQGLDSLGAGFTLASHDMDIRGFGNLLGEEQSGHIREVGVELYQQMLEEAVTDLKAGRKERKEEAFSPQINLGIEIFIPEDYVPDLGLRLSLYRRLSDLKDEQELFEMRNELMDRFGPIPPAVAHLMTAIRLKQLCHQLGIARIDTGPKGMLITFQHHQALTPEILVALMQKSPHRYKLRPDQKLAVSGDWEDAEARLAGVQTEIERLLKNTS